MAVAGGSPVQQPPSPSGAGAYGGGASQGCNSDDEDMDFEGFGGPCVTIEDLVAERCTAPWSADAMTDVEEVGGAFDDDDDMDMDAVKADKQEFEEAMQRQQKCEASGGAFGRFRRDLAPAAPNGISGGGASSTDGRRDRSHRGPQGALHRAKAPRPAALLRGAAAAQGHGCQHRGHGLPAACRYVGAVRPLGARDGRHLQPQRHAFPDSAPDETTTRSEDKGLASISDSEAHKQQLFRGSAADNYPSASKCEIVPWMPTAASVKNDEKIKKLTVAILTHNKTDPSKEYSAEQRAILNAFEAAAMHGIVPGWLLREDDPVAYDLIHDAAALHEERIQAVDVIVKDRNDAARVEARAKWGAPPARAAAAAPPAVKPAAAAGAGRGDDPEAAQAVPARETMAVPAIMMGRDVIGLAEAGSGKVLAFLLPMLRHVMDQPKPAEGEGPIGLIVAPADELALQLYNHAKLFTTALELRAVAVYDGADAADEVAEMRRGADIVVCTPGRMIDILTMQADAGKLVSLKRVSMVVMHEADRVLDNAGFGQQMRTMFENVRSDRQALLFAATYPPQVQQLAKKFLKVPLQIIVETLQAMEVQGDDGKCMPLLQAYALSEQQLHSVASGIEGRMFHKSASRVEYCQLSTLQARVITAIRLVVREIMDFQAPEDTGGGEAFH